MSLRINDTASDFTAGTTQGTINFHGWTPARIHEAKLQDHRAQCGPREQSRQM